MLVIVYTCLHPRKLRAEDWLTREVEYFYCLHNILHFAGRDNNVRIIDNSISDVNELLFAPLKELLYRNVYDWGISENIMICRPDLYSDINRVGTINMIRYVKDLFKDETHFLMFNGRQFLKSGIVFLASSKWLLEDTDIMRLGQNLQNENIIDDNVLWIHERSFNAIIENYKSPNNLKISVFKNRADILRIEIVGRDYVGFKEY